MKTKKRTEFPIASLSLNDIKEMGFDASKVSDSRLQALAECMSDDLVSYEYFEETFTRLAEEFDLPRLKTAK